MRAVGPRIQHPFHFKNFLAFSLFGEDGEGRVGLEINGTGGRGIKAGEHS